MRAALRRCLLIEPVLACALLLAAPATVQSAPAGERDSAGGSNDTTRIDRSTWADHDHEAIAKPPDWEPNYWKRRIHQGISDPLSHLFDIPDKLLWMTRIFGANTRREAVNTNAFDEVPNSAWFTNRNHVRAMSVEALGQGPDSVLVPAKPWTVKHAKVGGWTGGFQIKDADGRKWLVKLDALGYPQLSSGADMVSRTLLHAAGYNVPNNRPVRFRRGDFVIDEELLHGTKGELFTESDMDSILAHGARFPDGTYSATASLFLEGHPLGSPSMNRLRPGDANDWYSHTNRRELRGLFVLCSWINNWDTEDHQFLDMFVETDDSLGHVKHYILDAGSSFGASASGPKGLFEGYENGLDLEWNARRFFSLGFVTEPWRSAKQESGFPSVGNYESAAYEPEDFKQLVPQPAFREMTERDGYWGAKIVASFSDAQIAAAVDAAHYEDPRASDYIVRNLITRRDKISLYWFEKVAPLDFFTVEKGVLRFRDLAVDIGQVGSRAYDVEITYQGGRTKGDRHLSLVRTELPLAGLPADASLLLLELSIAGSGAKATHVELRRTHAGWAVTRVRHG